MPGAPSKKPSSRRAKAAARTATPAKKAVKAAPTKAVAKKAAPTKGVAKKAAAPKKTSAAAAKKAVKAPKKAAVPVKKAAAPTKKAAPAKKAAAAAPAKVVGARKKTVVCELSGFEVTPSPPALSAKTLERLKGKLLEEKERLLHQADELTAEAEELAREREAGDTQFDEESGEGDTVNVERERDLLLSATARQVVDEIDEALLRMKKGSYGVCRYAGRKLPVDRLEAIPWASVCVDCKGRADRRR